MHANRNKKAVKRVSRGLLKANQSRNCFAVIAIILTTVMITSVFSLGISYKENYDMFLIRQAGTKTSISLPNPTDEQYEKMKSLDYLESVGRQYYIGTSTQRTEMNTEIAISLLCYDKEEWDNHFLPAISNVQGSYPQNADEIIMSEGALSLLGIEDPVLKQTVKINYETPQGTKSGEYKLSGWFKSYGSGVKNIILFSEEYCKDNGITLEENGTVNISAKDNAEAYDLLGKDIILKENQKFNSLFIESSTSSIIQVAAFITLIVLFIMMSGFLLIYNVFYISVSKEINKYGMLKTLGTSQKQIQNIIINQALHLAFIGIPVGLVLSALFSLVLVPSALKSLAGNDFDKVSFSPLIFISAAVFSLVTVFFSAWKPARMAGRISPVEALRYTTANSGSKNKKIFKTKNGAKPYKMAWRNIFRNKKQTVLVVVSLFLGSITMLCINGGLDCINVDNYVERYCENDFAFENKEITEEQFSDAFIQSLQNIDGIKDFTVSYAAFLNVEFNENSLAPILKHGFEDGGGSYDNPAYYQNFLETMRMTAEEGEYGAWLQTLDSKYIEQYNKTHENQINLNDFEAGKTAVSLGYDYTGAELTLLEDANKRTKLRIDGMLKYEEIHYAVNPQIILGTPGVVLVSESFMKNLNCDSNVYSVVFNVDPYHLTQAEDEVKELTKNLTGASYQLYIKSEIRQSFEDDMMNLRVIGNSISIFLLAIGILNFINLMMTGIYSRHREFAVMQSIGVTAKQIRKLLSFEGLYYALMTAVLILTVGSGILYAESKVILSIADYAVFRYPLLQLMVLFVSIFILCLIVPLVIYKSSAKSTITERLRAIES